MDFAAQMEALIGKAKSQDRASAVKRAELLAKQDEEYYAQQQKEDEEREARRAEKRKREEEWEAREERRREKMRKLSDEAKIKREKEAEEAERKRRKRLGLPPLPEKNRSQSGTPGPEVEDIEDAELVENLRAMAQPATLFGETHEQRLRRYRRLTNVAKVYKGPIDTTLEPVPEKDMKIPPKPPKDPKERKFLYRQLASFFTLILQEWQIAMDKRSREVKNSTSGRQAESVMKQAREFLAPLYRMLEKESLDDELLSPIVEIVFEAQGRRYVKANDAYLRLSIGKAAWPIGVTMVGIHARSAREKLHESETAHIMADETTRKMLQSIKRCLTFAQTRWPPDDHLQLMG